MEAQPWLKEATDPLAGDGAWSRLRFKLKSERMELQAIALLVANENRLVVSQAFGVGIERVSI